MHGLFACALLNGSEVLRCPLRGEAETRKEGGKEEREASGETVCLAPEAVVLNGDGDGGSELHVVFFSPNVVPRKGLRWEGRLVLDGGRASVSLGAITTRREKQVVEASVGFVPNTAVLHVREAVIDLGPDLAADGPEAVLINRAVSVMEDSDVNPRCGSLPVSVVENALREGGCKRGEEDEEDEEEEAEGRGGRRSREDIVFKEVVGGLYGGDVEAFLGKHSSSFTLFRYTSSEIKGRGMCDYVNPGETRVVLKKGKRVQFYDSEDEEQTLTFMKQILSEGDLTSDELLSAVHTAGKGLAISPAFSQLMRFLSRNKHVFSWSTDPSQVTMVGLASSSSSSSSSSSPPSSSSLPSSAKKGRSSNHQSCQYRHQGYHQQQQYHHHHHQQPYYHAGNDHPSSHRAPAPSWTYYCDQTIGPAVIHPCDTLLPEHSDCA